MRNLTSPVWKVRAGKVDDLFHCHVAVESLVLANIRDSPSNTTLLYDPSTPIPRTVAFPPEGLSIPKSILIVVLLPALLAPRNAVIRCDLTLNVKPRTASVCPKVLSQLISADNRYIVHGFPTSRTECRRAASNNRRISSSCKPFSRISRIASLTRSWATEMRSVRDRVRRLTQRNAPAP